MLGDWGISYKFLFHTISSWATIVAYNLFRLDRLHKRGGGVCAYVRKELKASVLKELSEISETDFHQLWIKVQCKKFKSLLICVFEIFFKHNYIQALIWKTFILGDLNCNLLKTSREQKALNDVSTELNVTQIINDPTRITNTCHSLIDVILTSSSKLVRESGVLNNTIRDHLPVYAILKLRPPKKVSSFVTVRSYKHYNPSSLSSDLASNSDRLLSILLEHDVKLKLKIFNDIFYSVLEVHAPIKIVKIRSRSCPYITREIKDMRDRDRLHRRFLQTRDNSDWNDYKEYHN